MSTFILDECIACDACRTECPNTAIIAGEQIYYILADRCTECVGFHEEEQCAKVCPVDVCLPNPDHIEEESELIEKARKLHPDKDFGETFPSHFRVLEDGKKAF